MSDFNKKLKIFEKQINKKIMTNLVNASEYLLEKSNELVPVDTGALRSSGKVVVTKPLQTSIIYDSEYATVVHEDLEKYHPIGQAKFLETAILNESNIIIKKIGEDK